MLFKTQRSLADSAFEGIKDSVKASKLDFLLQESAFSATIKIRKKYLVDYSPMSNQLLLPTSTPDPVKDSKNPQTIFQSDSGIFDDRSNELENIQKELVETILESKNKTSALSCEINQFKENETKKSIFIEKLQCKIKKIEQENSEFKNLENGNNIKLEKVFKEKDELEKDLKKTKKENVDLKKVNSSKNEDMKEKKKSVDLKAK